MNVAWTKIVLLAACRTMNRILMGENVPFCILLWNRTPNIKCRITVTAQVVVSVTAATNSSVHKQATHYY